VGYEAVERASGGDVLGHGDVAESEDGQHDRREQETGRRAEAVAEPDRDRHIARHRRDRRRVGDGHEDDRDDADGTFLQPGRRGCGLDGCGFSGHAGLLLRIRVH
jgi:hypothetical protein